MKTVLIVIGCLFLAFLLLFIFCACRVASWCDREEEAMFEHWYANHTSILKRRLLMHDQS